MRPPQRHPHAPKETADEHCRLPDALAFDLATSSTLQRMPCRSYGGSVKALAVVKRLAEALGYRDLPPYVYEHLWHRSVVFHEQRLHNLGGNRKLERPSARPIAMARVFDAGETEFRKIAAGLGGGSGWVVLRFNQHTRTFENYADHAPLHRRVPDGLCCAYGQVHRCFFRVQPTLSRGSRRCRNEGALAMVLDARLGHRRPRC